MPSLNFQNNHDTEVDILVSMTTKGIELLIGQKMTKHVLNVISKSRYIYSLVNARFNQILYLTYFTKLNLLFYLPIRSGPFGRYEIVIFS